MSLIAVRPSQNTTVVPALEALFDISCQLQRSTDLTSTLDLLLRRLTAEGIASSGTVLLADPKTGRLVVAASMDAQLATTPSFISTDSSCACGRAYRSGEIASGCDPNLALDCPLCSQTHVVAIPIPGVQKVHGVIAFVTTAPSRQRSTFERKVQIVATELGMILDRQELEMVRDQDQVVLSLLDDLSSALAEQISPGQLTTTILEQLSRNLPTDATALVLYNVKDDSFDVIGRIDKQQWTVSADLVRASLDCLIHTRRTLWVPDNVAFGEFLPPLSQPRSSAELPASLIAAPLLVSDRLLGGIILVSFSPAALTESHAYVVTALANQIASGLEIANVSISQQATLEKLEALYATSQALTSRLKLEDVMELCLDIMAALVKADSATFYTVTKGQDFLQARARKGFALRFSGVGQIDTLPLDQGLNARAFRTGRIVNVPDVRQVDDYLEVDSSTRAQLVVPLAYGDDALGTVDLESPQVGAFEQVDLDVLITLAGQVAIALKNAELRRGALNDACAINSLQAATAALVGQRDLATLAKVICRAALEVSRGAIAALGLTNETNRQVDPVAIEGPQGSIGADSCQPWPSKVDPDHPIHRAIADRQVVVWPDFSEKPATVPCLAAAAADGYRSLVAVPMISGLGVVGVLTVYSYNVHSFSGQQLDVLQAFAGQAAFAVELIKGRENLSARNRALATLGAVVDSVAADFTAENLAEVLLRIQRGLKFDAGLIYIIDEQDRYKLELVCYSGLAASEAEHVKMLLVHDDLDVEAVIDRGKPVFSKDSSYFGADGTFRARAAIPLLVGGQVGGVLILASEQPRSFDTAETLALTTIGQIIELGLAR
jgi:GAF domain-containing protein